MRLTGLASVLILVSFVSCQVAADKPSIAVLANSIDIEGTKRLLESLNQSGVNAVLISPGQVKEAANHDITVILGGHNSPEGIGELARRIMTDQDMQRLMIPGSWRMIRGESIFRKGHVTFVFAGHGKEETRMAWNLSWMSIVDELKESGMQALIIDAPQMVTIVPMRNLLSFTIPISINNTGEFDLLAVDIKASIGSGSLLVEPAILDIPQNGSVRAHVRLDPKRVAHGDEVIVSIAKWKVKTVLNVTEKRETTSCSICKAGGL